MKSRLVISSLLLTLALSPALGASDDLWLHVFVQESGDEAETVKVNIPMALVESVLPLIDHEHLSKGKLNITEELGAEGIDLREIWEAVRNTKDGDFVTVESKDESVRVSKSQGFLKVDVEEDGEKIRVRVPLDVVGALFSGEDGELDILAAVRALGKYKGQDLVTVEGGSETIRVWIDESQELRP